MQEVDAISEQVSILVYNSPHHSIMGSALAPLVKRAFPGFDPVQFGCLNLRDFLRRYVKDVFESGRSGSDVLYSVLRLPTVGETSAREQEFEAITRMPVPRTSSAIDRPVWKTFVSPAGKFRAYGNRETGDLMITLGSEAAPESPWVQIPPCSPAVHLQIAKDFVAGLGEGSTKVELGKILCLNSWWEPFFVTTRSLGIQKPWASFRRRNLHVEFRKSLQGLGIPFATNPARSAPPPLTTDALTNVTSPAGTGDEAFARQIAIEIIQRLPLSDLREVWLPLGSFVDELKKRRGE